MTPPDPSYPGMPRWVKVTLVVLAAVVVLAIAALALGLGGPHGPSRHTGGGHGEASPVAAGAVRSEVIDDRPAFSPAGLRVDVGTHVAIALTSVDTLHDSMIMLGTLTDEGHG